MAEIAISFVLDKLGNFLIEEADLLRGIRDKVEWLQRELRWMQCFLKDADAKRRKGKERAKNWVREVREVSHQAEDIVDAFALEIEIRRQEQGTSTGGGIMRHIQRYAALPWDLIAVRRLGSDIKGLRAKIDQIKESSERYGLVDLGEATAESSGRSSEETLQKKRRISPHTHDDTAVVAFDDHKKRIVEQLVDPGIRRRCVVSIVGPGGIGKTTLANKVYNSLEATAHFRTRACVSVSQDYSVGELLKGIARQVMDASETSDEVEDLEEKLFRRLKERRYFIVLDDVWRTDVWEQTRAFLPDASNGSRVLVTTRSMDVARSADPGVNPYQLPLLNDEESWDLFLRKTFADPISCCPEELEHIGRRLVKRCGGLPLALLVLGGIVSRKDPNPAAWMRVADHLDWASTRDGEDCLDILGLSYDDLPHHHLRSCFLYLGAFPEDSEIAAPTMIHLWIAEGFIPRRTEGQMMEDTAQDYLEELAQRSMIQVVSKDLDGSVVAFRVHDLFRDLCIREAREDGFFSVSSTCRGKNLQGSSPKYLQLQETVRPAGSKWSAGPPTVKSVRKLIEF